MDKQSLSKAEIEQLEQEINAAIDTLINGCEKLDMEMAFSMFANSIDFLMMGTDGTLCNYETYLKNNIDYLLGCSSFKLTTYRSEIRILDPEIAIYSWAYGAEATLKTGEQDIIDNAGASFVFEKANGAWKVVYYHESSAPPRRIMPVN